MIALGKLSLREEKKKLYKTPNWGLADEPRIN